MAITKDKIDVEESVTPSIALETTVHNDGSVKQREVVNVGSPDAGGGAGAIAEVLTSNPTTEAGLVVRNIPSGTQAVNGTVTADQGNPIAVANAWPTKLVDGSGVNVASVTINGDQKITLDDEAGTAGVPSASVITVQGIASMTALTVSDATAQGSLSSIDGKITACNTGAVVIASGTVTANQGSPPWEVDGQGIAGTPAGGVLSVQGVVGGTALPISATALPLPAGAATSANQLPDGHNVTIDNGAAGAAVNIQDGGNTITVDGTVTADAGTGPFVVAGEVAHDAAASGTEPMLIAGRANANEPTAVGDGDVCNVWVDTLGRVVTVGGHPSPEPPVTVNGTASGTSVIGAPGSGSLYICKGSVINRAASAQIVSLRDGAGGTIRWRAQIGADGGGALFDFGPRGWKLSATTALIADIAASSADVNVTEYYIAP